MNRKPRRALASNATKQARKYVTEQLKKINEQHRMEVAQAQQLAEKSLFNLLDLLGIKEAGGRWVTSGNQQYWSQGHSHMRMRWAQEES